VVSAKILNFEHKSRDSTSTVLVHGYMLALHLLSEESLLSTLVTPRYMHRNTEYNSHVHSNYAICRVKTLCVLSLEKKNLHFLAGMSCLCPDSLIIKGRGKSVNIFCSLLQVGPSPIGPGFLFPFLSPHPPRRYFSTAPDLPRRVGAQATHRRGEPIEADGGPRGNSARGRAPEA